MRCYAYQLPSDLYLELETDILATLATGEREKLVSLLKDADLEIELLSGEWRLLFAEAQGFYHVVDEEQGIARMAISPDELADFVELIRDPDLKKKWAPTAFGLAELTDALPPDCALAGVVLVEESDDWLWAEANSEMMAIRPEVFELLQAPMQKLLDEGHHAQLARLASDHCEGSVEFPEQRWQTFLTQAKEQVPELAGVVERALAGPGDYTSIREALAVIADPQFQPSLDAWLRVHADGAQYALYFRDATRENA